MLSKFFLIFFFLFSFICNMDPSLIGEEEFSESVKYSMIIPSISLNSEICSTSREVCLSSGIWMKYGDERKNLLFTGHSFSLLPLRAGVFYALGDVKVGERIYVELENLLVYEVYEVFVTDRFDLEVENFENLENTLVLYSCFPLWSANGRIVVIARLCDSCENEI